uniref:Ig-like domain-containing protein n=1 Tax=Falco tinnunculus TaxID=100819 RepID=A0A8C4UEZ2_FALTI
MDCKLVFAGNDHSLIIPYAAVQDEGEYTCVASNVHGETACSAHLHVRQRTAGVPCFAREPDSVRCAPGFSAVFEYTVAGEPCPDVLWFKGSEQLSSDARCSVVHHPDGSGSLTVQQCTEEDTGLYTCRAVNVLGEATCSAELLVLPEEHLTKKDTVLGSSIQMECKVSGSLPITAKWFKDGKEITDSAKYRSLCHENTIRKPSPEDMLKGTEVSLECEISGTPPFDVTWYKDRRQIRSSKKYKVTAKNYHTSVHILNVEAADVGEYQCKAQNDVGSDTCFCTVKLKGKVLPPKFLTKINSVTVVVGEPVELQARVEGSQPISVQWLKDKDEIIRESENTKITFMENIATLQFLRTETSSAGKYICQIRNDAGSRECMANLTILGW